MKNNRVFGKTMLGVTVAAVFLNFVVCSAQELPEQETEMATELEEKYHHPVQIKQSPDKSTWYLKDYVGKNTAAFGYTSMGGDRMDHYGEGYLELILVNEDGHYIDINNEDELKNYVVTAQNLAPNTELKYTFEEDEVLGSQLKYQNIEEIVLAVKEVGGESPAMELTEIAISPDECTWYIRDYVGRNLASCGYASMGGELRDAYGESTVVFVIVPEDGSYIEAKDEETLKKYVVTGQSVAPNSELKLEMERLEGGDGIDFGNLLTGQNIEEIELYVAPVD